MRDHQEIDRWLDDTLKQYTDIEPRPGLERRVLARLASEERVRQTGPWWTITALGSVALLTLLAFWLHPMLNSVSTPETGWETHIAPPASSLEPVPTSKAPSDRRRVVLVARERVSVQPKAERFPCPSPLTEQEKMLARFAQDFPQKAALVAQTQTDLYEQDQKEMARPWPAKENN